MPLFRKHPFAPTSPQGRPRRADAPAAHPRSARDAAKTHVIGRGAPGSGDHATALAGATAAALLKRYRPLETRATGGFGSVEVCLDTRLKRRVAIKRIPLAAPLATTPTDVRATALAEARTASMLAHPNIVSVIDFTYDEAYAYLVMEYVDGMSLEEFLAGVDGHSLTYDEAACVADALTQALAFAHENGVLHLDIKPANVLIDRSGHVKLADFGMATLTSAAGFGGARGGTIGYMAPEQLLGEEVDERSDIFSLAALLYEALCATAPFRAGAPADSLKRIEEGVVTPHLLLPDIPADAEDVMVAALDPDPTGRPMLVDDFADAFLAGLGDAREGRRSLARIIARLTEDDVDEEVAEAGPSWEFDPALGVLGSRWPQARAVGRGLLSGLSVMAASHAMLGVMGVVEGPARIAAAAAIGLAAGIAPQVGSALVTCCLVMMVVGATELLPALGSLVVIVPVFAGWWYVWGRGVPSASAVAALCVAGALATGSAAAPLAPAALIAAYAMGPVAAAASCAFGAFLAALTLAATSAGGALGGLQALSALVDVRFLLVAVAASALAAGASALFDRGAARAQDERGTALVWGACILPGIVVVLLYWLANPMENSALGLTGGAAALGAGGLSTIIAAICVYLLGYSRNPTEGDRR